MPGPRTYQAIGFATYKLGLHKLRSRAPEIKRNLAAAAIVALAIAAAAQAASEGDSSDA
jgi:hypothetical protein